jgi:cell wall-associated NlpC family hydrolase
MNRRDCPAWVVFCLLFLTLKSTAVERNIQPSIRSTGAFDLLLHFAGRIHHTNLDCSHFVHTVYERVGLHYDYATSRKLYRGQQEFRRVSAPQPGDLIVWRGHVGIVVRPEQHTFLSAIAKGVSLSSYTSQYWAKRGEIRFFHYIETGTPG